MWSEMDRFLFWSGVLALTHWAFAAVVVGDTHNAAGWEVPVHLRYNAWEQCENNKTAPGPACDDTLRLIVSVYTPLATSPKNPGYLAAGFSVVSGANHCITCLIWWLWPGLKEWVLGNSGRGPNVLRSLDWGISASLMMVVNLFLYAIPADFTALVGYGLLTAITILAGYGLEHRQAILAETGPEDGTWSLGNVPPPFWALVLLYTVAWVPLLMIFPGAAFNPSQYERFFYNGTRYPRKAELPPDEVIVFITWLLVSFFLFPWVQCWKLGFGRSLTPETNLRAEYWFMVLSALSKLPLLLLFYSGVAGRRGTTLDPEATGRDARPDSFDFAPFGAGIGIAFALAIAIRCTTKNSIIPAKQQQPDLLLKLIKKK